MTTTTPAFLPAARLPGAALLQLGATKVASRMLVGFTIVAAMLAGFLATSQHDAALAIHQAGPELTRLLRGMAAIKAIMAAGVSAAVLWRLGSAAAWPWLSGYMLAGAVMAAGPGLIWSMAHVTAGALCLHAGLLASILLLWRDPATSRKLAASIARRQR